ncbi:hypothetical protein FOA52_002505 [Chlamydomonas sp. UWO 241]|nr:hypothetical protein FOA52_002505 [Chlamydomonas sp. UWO 241]
MAEEPGPSTSQQSHEGAPLMLQIAQELREGRFWAKCSETLPKPTWGIKEVTQMLQYGVPVSLVFTAIQAVQILRVAGALDDTTLPQLKLPAALTDAVATATASLDSARVSALSHLGTSG